jgi:hypothetical protein
MSWKNLLEVMNEEFDNKEVLQKRPKEKDFFNRMAREIVEDRVDELDLKSAVGKVKSAAKRGWQVLAGKIKEVALRGFKMGVAVGKTVKGKFVLFNRSGTILTPEADKVEFKKIASGKRPLTLTYKSPAGPMPISVSDSLNRGFGTAITKDGDGVFFVVQPKTEGVKEDIDYDYSEIIIEAEEEEEEEPTGKSTASIMAQVDQLVFGSFADEGAEALKASEDKPKKIVPVEVTYEDFNREISDLLRRVKEGTVLKGSKIKNLAIYAPTGWGKTEIIGKAAKAAGYFFFPLELQKVPIEILSGFPFLDDVQKADEETKGDRLERAMKIVKMAPSQYLPPAGSQDAWLLFFDEFNRADTEKMSAVMNLLLNGELGGASELIINKKTSQKTLDRYRLPKKVVVVLAMNTGMQKAIADSMNAVKDLDIATLERVHRVLHGKYHAESWFKSFAALPHVTETESGKEVAMLSRIPPIILNFIQDLMKTKGSTGLDPEKPFLQPIKVAGGEPGGGGGERTTSPRSWTMIADDMIERGVEQWNSLSKESQDKFDASAKKIKAKIESKWDEVVAKDPEQPKKPPQDLEPYKFAAWLNAAQNQIRLLAMESPELGDEGTDYIRKMIKSFIKRGKEGITEEDILLNYKAVREQVKDVASIGFGTKSALLARLYFALTKYKNEQAILDFMAEKGIPVLSKKGPVEQIYLTFKQMYTDLDFAADDFIAFTHLVDQAAKKAAQEGNADSPLRLLHGKLANWQIYVDALKKKVTTKSGVEKELAALTGGGKKSSKKGEEGGEEGEEEEKKEDRILNFLKGIRLE